MRISCHQCRSLRSMDIHFRAHSGMRYFPVFMDLQREPVLIVGGGAVAERKIRLLLKAGALVRVVADQLSETVAEWKNQGRIEHLGRSWNPQYLEEVRLVFAATDDAALNRQVYRSAEQLRIPVNAVDDQSHCRFISPAVVDRSPIQVAISTGGTAPVLARRIRNWVERLLPENIGRIAAAAGRVRSLAKKTLPASKRRHFWEELLNDRRLLAWSHNSEDDIRAAMTSALRSGDGQSGRGKVFLVGAGPGRADLLTLRALEILGRADVILHDRLVTDEILDLARRDADRIYVGKQAGNHHRTQQQIHRIMLEQAGQGKTVVRLKGGDPFIFGRGGEELEVLRAHDVEYEVVPGITAALGCAAYSGIPLTHRDHSKTVTFVTGHLSSQSVSDGIDWSGIAGHDRTTVVYMGVGQARNLRNRLLEAGIDRDLPVALVMDGTRETQQVVHGTVGGLPALARASGEGVPALLIIGQVAALGSNLGWFTQQANLKTAA